jgi:5-methylcytosine-specific restriction endonuclease McrA
MILEAVGARGGSLRCLCDNCGTEYVGVRSQVARCPRHYCSRKCMGEGKRNRVGLICTSCGTAYSRPVSIVEVGAKRGHRRHFCSDACQRDHHRGPNHPAYVADRSTLKAPLRSLRYSKEGAEWRKSVFRRDNYTCQFCGKRSRKGHPVTIHAHHIKRFADFPALRFEPDNGITLCRGCHATVTGREAEFEARFAKAVEDLKHATAG